MAGIDSVNIVQVWRKCGRKTAWKIAL